MYNLTIEIQSYIADPYWPEREMVINIQKESGMNRARSSANRRKALEEHLRSIEMSLLEYDQLVAQAERPFYLNPEGKIIVPKKQIDGMLVSTCTQARAAFKPCSPDVVRSVLRSSIWTTDLTQQEANIWERYAVVSAGTGAKLSNQRALRRNWYIGGNPPEGDPTKPVIVHGTIEMNKDMVRPEVLGNALKWAGDNIGIGAARKMGWGRFTVKEFKAAD